MNRQHQIIGSEVGRRHPPGLLSIRAYPPARRPDWYRVAGMAMAFASVVAFIWTVLNVARMMGA